LQLVGVQVKGRKKKINRSAKEKKRAYMTCPKKIKIRRGETLNFL